MALGRIGVSPNEWELVRRLGRSFSASTWMTLIVSWASIFLLSATWAISSPLGASPDEPAHIIKAAAVARGQIIGEPTPKPAVTRVLIPAGLAQAGSWPCYAFDSTREANCTPPVSNASNLVNAETSAGLYNPVYYALVGLPSLITSDTSLAVMMMRLTSALISSLFLAISFCALMRLGDPLITGLGFLAAMTPMALFLNGAVNPNSLEVATGAALLTSLLVVIRGESGHERVWLGGVAFSGVLMAQSRGLSPLWMALIALTAIIYPAQGRLRALLKRWDVWATVLIVGAGVGAAAMWIIETGTLQSMGVFPGAGKIQPTEAFIEMLVARSFDPGTVGVFGWLDTPAPTFDYVLWSSLSLGTLLLAVCLARGRELASVLVCLAGFMLIPPIVQAASVNASGYIWQGRYALVGYVVLVMVSAVSASSGNVSWSDLGRHRRTRVVATVGGLVALGQALALATTIKRYAVGTDISWFEASQKVPLWLPPGGAVVWLVLSVGGSLLIVCLWAFRSHNAAALRDPGSHRATALSSR
jgi:hypothetical protein